MGRARFYTQFLEIYGNNCMDSRVHAFVNMNLKRVERIQLVSLFRGMDRQLSSNIGRGDNPMDYPMLEGFRNNDVELVSNERFRGLQNLITLDFVRFIREIRPSSPRHCNAAICYGLRRGWTAMEFCSWTLT